MLYVAIRLLDPWNSETFPRLLLIPAPIVAMPIVLKCFLLTSSCFVVRGGNSTYKLPGLVYDLTRNGFVSKTSLKDKLLTMQYHIIS